MYSVSRRSPPVWVLTATVIRAFSLASFRLEPLSASLVRLPKKARWSPFIILFLLGAFGVVPAWRVGEAFTLRHGDRLPGGLVNRSTGVPADPVVLCSAGRTFEGDFGCCGSRIREEGAEKTTLAVKLAERA